MMATTTVGNYFNAIQCQVNMSPFYVYKRMKDLWIEPETTATTTKAYDLLDHSSSHISLPMHASFA
jgi:hypothetical protein